MMETNNFIQYKSLLMEVFHKADFKRINILAESLLEAWQNKKQVFLCGNGGSAANAIHIANDFFYGIAKDTGMGIKAYALPANQSILTCLANDISYDNIFSQQLLVSGEKTDILIALSGSGNSPNIIRAIETANKLGMKTFAILGYSGGKCFGIADVPIHFPVDDMQISEDMQLIVGHMLMQWLRDKNFSEKSKA